MDLSLDLFLSIKAFSSILLRVSLSKRGRLDFFLNGKHL